MNIIDFWKEFISEKTDYTQYDRNDFLQALTTNVPDWKEQVKNKAIWPNLHSQGMNVNESVYTRLIIEESGLEFAYYLIENQWGKRHLDASIALDYCVGHISSDWCNFPKEIKEKVLSYHLDEFLVACQQKPSLWTDLDNEFKTAVLNGVEHSEKSGISDLLLFSLWSKELNYKNTPYVHFVTDHFKHLKRDILSHLDSNRHYEERIEKWDVPSIHLDLDHLRYQPSLKLTRIEEIAALAADNDSISFLQLLKNRVRALVEMNW